MWEERRPDSDASRIGPVPRAVVAWSFAIAESPLRARGKGRPVQTPACKGVTPRAARRAHRDEGRSDPAPESPRCPCRPRPDRRADPRIGGRVIDLYLSGACRGAGRAGWARVTSRGRQGDRPETRRAVWPREPPHERAAPTELIQIDLQWEGHAAMVTRPLVAHHLGLTNEQLAAMKQALAARDAARVKGASPTSAEQTLAERAEPLLTPNQRLLWREMRGAPFVPQIATGRSATRSVR